MERERVRVKGGPTGLPKFFGGVIVGDGLGYSSFGGGDAFSVPSAVGWWAREFCAVGSASSLWIALSSSSVELGGSAFGFADFRYFFKSALWGRGSDRNYLGGGWGHYDDLCPRDAVGSASLGVALVGGIFGSFLSILFRDQQCSVVDLGWVRQKSGGVDSGSDRGSSWVSADLDIPTGFGDLGSTFYGAFCWRGRVVGPKISWESFLDSLGSTGSLRWVLLCGSR